MFIVIYFLAELYCMWQTPQTFFEAKVTQSDFLLSKDNTTNPETCSLSKVTQYFADFCLSEIQVLMPALIICKDLAAFIWFGIDK